MYLLMKRGLGFIVLLLAWTSMKLCAHPIDIKACAVLPARLDSAALASAPDTKRIQQALHLCMPGHAVVLEQSEGKTAFLSAPLILPRGVTLFVEKGVTLYASTNRSDYDLRPGSCGVQGGAKQACKPFLFAYQAAYSGLMGDGAIDGQATKWRPRQSAKDTSGSAPMMPDLVSSYESQSFSVLGLTLKNAPGTSVSIYKTIGFRVDGTRIETKFGEGNGILLSNSPEAHLSHLSIAVPGAAVDLRASILGGTEQVDIEGVRISGGRGISSGDDVYGSVSAVNVSDSIIENAERGLNFNLTGTQGGSLHGVQLKNVCLSDVSKPLEVERLPGAGKETLLSDRGIVFDHVADVGHGLLQSDGSEQAGDATCSVTGVVANIVTPQWNLDLSTVAKPGRIAKLVVAQDGSGNFSAIQQAVNALPDIGGTIAVKPGVYREVVTIRKPHVRLYGIDPDPTKTEITFDNTGPRNGGTFNSATVFVEADNISIDHLTIANDAGSGKGQAVALAVTADRAVFRHLRLTGAQDTLFAASQYCYGDYGPCLPARQYFSDCYIEGNVDFIFGDSEAVFERCELHGIAGKSVMYTAQSRHDDTQPSGYVFDHCRLTADPDAQHITLGRPWRPYATVVYLNTEMDAPVIPVGWSEWPRFGVPSLPTAYYAEFHSSGPRSDPSARESSSHQLTAAEAARWKPKLFLGGTDGWNPMRDEAR
jgi:pectin methylesterase-like acyl-CoA thioesterase